MTNPYVWRGPVRSPDMFFGRTHELNEIAAFLRSNQSVSIVGPRKIGKTSLLFHLMRPHVWPGLGLEADNLFVYLDCEVLGEGGHTEIFGQFAAEIAMTLDERGLPLEPALDKAIANPTRLAFEGAVRRLNRRGLRVVLILDEFERLSTNPELNLNFFNALRSAAGRYQLVFLTASARPLIELTYSGRSQEILSSPFFNIFAQQFLGLLPEVEAHRLIREPAQQAGMTVSPTTADFLYDLVSGHPLALQVACFHACKVASERDTTELEQRTKRELKAHFQYYWQNLKSVEQDVLRQVNEFASRATKDTSLRGVLRDLVQKCLLIGEEGTYRYPGRAWTDFVAAQTPAPTPSHVTGGELLTQTHLGSYEVFELLGRGGMAAVYKGRHARLDRTVAIKVLPTSLAAEVDFRQRFEREARAVANLKHPNVVQIFDFGEAAGMYYMVMEYIAGNDLRHYITETAPMSLIQARPLLQDVAAALDYAHAQGLIHRDIKPANVLLEPVTIAGALRQRAVLTDFGIAKLVTSSTGATKTGTMLGTLAYMAPEQINASREIDHRADIYSLGAMTYQMLTGQVPFGEDNPAAIVFAHLQQPAPDPRLLIPALPNQVATAIMHAMAKEPDERQPTAGSLVEALCK